MSTPSTRTRSLTRHAGRATRAASCAALALAAAGCGKPAMHGNAPFGYAWFSRDSRTALTAGGLINGSGAALWDVATGRLIRTIRLAEAPGNNDAQWWVSRDLDFVLTRGAVFDLATGALRTRLDSTIPITRVIALAPNDSAAWALTADSIVGFDLTTGARTAAAPRPVAGPNARFDHAQVSGDGRWLAFYAGGNTLDDGAVYLAELPALTIQPAAYQPPYPYGGSGVRRGGAWTQGMLFSPDNHTLAISDGFEQVTLYDVTTRRMLRHLTCEFRVHMRMAIPMGFSPDGSRLVAHEGPEYPGLCLFEIPSGRLVRSIPEPMKYDRRLMIATGGQRLVAWRRGWGPFETWDLTDGHKVTTFCPMPAGCTEAGGPQSRNVFLSPDGRIVFASDQQYINGIWDAESGRLRAWLSYPDQPRPWETWLARLNTALSRWL